MEPMEATGLVRRNMKWSEHAEQRRITVKMLYATGCLLFLMFAGMGVLFWGIAQIIKA